MKTRIVNRIDKYGIILNRLTEDKIELLRQWRNHPKIQQYMEYREDISPEMQKAWFDRIDNEFNHYFIIEADGKDIGCVNIRDIDYDKGEGEPGIFIWDDDYTNSTYSFRAIFALTDFCFEVLDLRRLVIHVLNNNKRAKDFNKSYGYRISSNQEGVYNQEYTLIPEIYNKVKQRIIRYLF